MPKPAGALRCPSCGAPASPQETSCAYCATPLALVSCPSCFAKAFRGARYCKHCGKELVRAVAPDRPARPCPDCREAMGTVRVGSVTLDECERCGGLWVDSGSFRRICAEREEQAVVLQLGTPSPGMPSPAEPQGYVPCPECRRLMNRQNFARVSGVILDVCRAHGVWFNPGELQRIVEFLRGGGMERARAREKAELEEERARLRATRLDARLAAARVPQSHRDGVAGATDYASVLSAVRGLLDSLF
jgi:Zn-finger nucleic acid-binding protein